MLAFNDDSFWAKEMKALDDGVFQEPSKRLSFETWEDFYDIFSDKGKAMIEELRKGHEDRP